MLPYDDRLKRLSAYLQQLEMESNGKSVTQEGERTAWETAAVIWGEPGSNAQHSFFQLLHQGTMRAALDFIAPVNSSCGDQHHQNLALANCLAQAEAFMNGQSEETVRADLKAQGMPAARIDQVAPHKVHIGDRPSTLILFSRLDPATLGKLVALYEHKVFTQGVIWGINSFDQWGVELGKKLAESLVPMVENPALAKDESAACQRRAGAHLPVAGTLTQCARPRAGCRTRRSSGPQIVTARSGVCLGGNLQWSGGADSVCADQPPAREPTRWAIFQGLSADQQQQIMQRLGGGGSSTSTGSTSTQWNQQTAQSSDQQQTQRRTRRDEDRDQEQDQDRGPGSRMPGHRCSKARIR